MFIILGHPLRLLHVRALLAKRYRGESEIRSTQWISFLILATISRRADTTGTVTGRSQGTQNITSPIHSKRCAKSTTWVSTTDSYETKSSGRTWIDNGRSEEICRQMDDVADEEHTRHLTPEEIDKY